jgi:RNA polymerase sigma-70 factor (ECF subfamily)
MNDMVGDAALRPRARALAALLRYFRDLDIAEEAFPGSVRARMPQTDRRVTDGLADIRRPQLCARRSAAPQQVRVDEEIAANPDDPEGALVERLDNSIATMCCACCSSVVIPICRQRNRSRWHCESFPLIKEIARAFIVGETAMEQRITRAKRRIADADVRNTGASNATNARPRSR